MKHYGAVLTGAGNRVDGDENSILTLGTDDGLVIVTANQSTDGSDPGAGLHISGGVARRATHVLAADGSELAIAGFGSVNSATFDVPVKGIDASGNSIFVNSIINEVGATNYDEVGDGATTSTISNATGVQIDGNLELTTGHNLTVNGAAAITGNTTISGNLDVTGETNFRHSSVSTYSDTYIELNIAQDVDPGDGNAGTGGANGIGGIVVESDFTRTAGIVTATQLGGLRFNGAHDSGAGRWEFNNNITNIGDINGAAGWTPFAEGTLTEVRNGNGITVSTSATEDGITGAVATPLVSANLTGAFATETTASQGGLAFTNLAGNGNTSIGIAQQGVDASMLDVTAVAGASEDNFLLSYNNADGNFTWVAPGGTGSVNKYFESFTKLAATTSMTISAANIMTMGIGANEQNLQVSVYEATTNGFSQVLPESIVIHDGGGATTAGDVVLTFGATVNDIAYKVVITG